MTRRLTPRQLAKRLREVRTALGWSQEQAAEDLGVHRISVVRWESGAVRLEGMARRLVELWVEKYGRQPGEDG